MNSGYQDILISLRQADGELFPLFLHGDPDTCNLSLIPAREGQSEADIRFYHHSSPDSEPVELGTLRFPDLPADAGGETELQLDAVLGPTGLLTVTVRHPESGRVERLEMEIPEEESGPGSRGSRGDWRNGPGRWVLGALFVLAALALIGFLTYRITGWGREAPVPAPVASVSERIRS